MISCRLLFLPILILFSSSSFAQKDENGLPEDLDVESIVSLKFDSMELVPVLSKAEQRDVRWRNEMCNKGNKALMEEVKKVSVQDTVASRSKVKELKAKRL